MKKIMRLVIPIIILFSLPFALYANVKAPFINAAKNTQVLFVLLSKEASIHATNKPGIYHLTLKGVKPKAIYFSNRPQRMSGQIPIQKLIAQWSEGAFNQVAPNAVIEAVKRDSHTHKLQDSPSSYAVVLNHPTFSTSQKDELSFEIKALPGNRSSLPTMAKSDYVAIFIDDVCLSCIG